MRRVTHLLAAILALALSAPLAWGDQPRVEVSVSPETARQGESVRVTISVSGENASKADIGVVPPKGDKLIPSGSISTSQSFSWINGRSNASKTFQVDYLATEAGEGTIPSFTLTFGERVHRTEPVKIRILPQGKQSADQSGRDSRIYVQSRIDRKQVYLGESVTLDYVLHSRVRVRGYDPDRLEPIPGFIIEDEKIDPQTTVRERTDKHGRHWNEYVLFRRHLTPTHTGTIEVPAAAFAFGVPSSDRDRLGFFFQQRLERVARIAPAVKIQVRALPEDGRPDDFTGGVSRFELVAKLSASRVEAGEAVNLIATVTGAGPMGTMSAPHLSVPPDVQAYDPLEEKAGSGRRRWVFPVVPRAPGTVKIEGVHLSYFDPSTGRYTSLKAGPFVLEVVAGKGAGGGGAGAGPAASPVKAQGTDLRFIHPLPRHLASRATGWACAPLAWAAAMFPLVGLPLILAGAHLRRRYSHSAAGRQARRRREIERLIRQARRSAGDGGDEAALALLKALHLWAEGIVGEPVRSIERSRLRRRLAERTGDTELAQEAVDLIDKAEEARYGGSAGVGSMDPLIEEVSRWVLGRPR